MVTNAMKPVWRTTQAVTQVKVLSSEMLLIIEADTLHDVVEGSKNNSDKTSYYFLYRGLRPWHVLRWNLGELGRSIVLLKFSFGYVETSLNSED